MDKICFLNFNIEDEQVVVNGLVKRVSNNVIEIEFEDYIPDNKVLLGGFEIINEFNGVNMTDDYYHKFNTLFKEVDECTVMLSDDGSVSAELAPEYSEPEIPEIDIETPEHVELDSFFPTLDEVKAHKIKRFSSICSNAITNGVDIEFEEGIIEHFSYSEEDQVNLKEIFDLAIQTNVPMYYHADGEGCKLYTVEQIIAIYISATTNKMHHTTYFNQIRMYINSLETVEDVNVVEYGQELTDEFLQTYNESMAQAQLVLEALLSKRAAMLAEG